jgi:hypothetical protein
VRGADAVKVRGGRTELRARGEANRAASKANRGRQSHVAHTITPSMKRFRTDDVKRDVTHHVKRGVTHHVKRGMTTLSKHERWNMYAGSLRHKQFKQRKLAQCWKRYKCRAAMAVAVNVATNSS